VQAGASGIGKSSRSPHRLSLSVVLVKVLMIDTGTEGPTNDEQQGTSQGTGGWAEGKACQGQIASDDAAGASVK